MEDYGCLVGAFEIDDAFVTYDGVSKITFLSL